MKYNSELQFIDTSDKAYLLGLFYSDGHVSSSNGTCGITGLEATNLNLFGQICLRFPFFSVKKHSITSTGNKAILLHCSSVLLKKHLIEYGVLPRKSYENKLALRLPILNPLLYRDFMRGFFDGDGYIVQTNSRNKMRMGIGGVNAYLMCDILSLLSSVDISMSMRIRTVEKMNEAKKKHGIFSRQEMYYIESLSFKETKKFMKYIYSGGDLLLKTKYAQAKDVLQYADIQVQRMEARPAMTCPRCSNPRSTYNGVRGKVPRQRMQCSKCKYRFTIDLPDIAPGSSNTTGAQDQLAHQELGYAA